VKKHEVVLELAVHDAEECRQRLRNQPPTQS
jgi:hypothetical protein